MKILILAAMDKEVSLLENLLIAPKETYQNGLRIITGKIGLHDVAISKCGIGKVNSALNAYRLIKLLKPDLLLNSGVAGGAALPIGTVLVADNIVYSDVWCGPGTDYGQADGIPLYMKPCERIMGIAEKFKDKISFGLICSSDKFISTKEEIKFIKNKFPEVKAVDMESASIAQTCFITDTPFAVVRVVSDTPGEGENISQYKDFWKEAPVKTFNILFEIINCL